MKTGKVSPRLVSVSLISVVNMEWGSYLNLVGPSKLLYSLELGTWPNSALPRSDFWELSGFREAKTPCEKDFAGLLF